MSLQIRDSITTNGLITYLDGAYSNSIVSGSLIWKDLTRQTADTSLVNGANFSTSKFIGGVNFDGVDDHIAIPYRSLTNESFAVELWMDRVYTTNYIQGILTCGNSFGGAFNAPPGWAIDNWTGNGSDIHFGLTDITGRTYNNRIANLSQTIAPFYKPMHVFAHRNTSTEKAMMYINGQKLVESTISNSITFGGGNRTTIGAVTWGYGANVMIGTYYMIKLYLNYNFTDSEIVQKFTSTRERFGV